ncbi:hypothetical protein EZS27_029219, partial [termite gut metagenome]
LFPTEKHILYRPKDALLPAGVIAIGTKSYANLNEAIREATSSGDKIELGAGTFVIDARRTIVKGVTLKGAGKDATIIPLQAPAIASVHDNADEGAFILGENAAIEDVCIKYNTTRIPGKPWDSDEILSGVILGKYDENVVMNTSVKNCRIIGFRNGIRANHNTGIVIEGNEISNNRHGIQLGCGATGIIKDNVFTNNEVWGLFFWGTEERQTELGEPTITGNTFSGNWVGDVGIQWGTIIDYKVNLNGNTFSSDTKTVMVVDGTLDTTLSVKSSHTFTQSDPGFQANIVTNKVADVTLDGYSIVTPE